MRPIDGARSDPVSLNIPNHTFAQLTGWRGRETARRSKKTDLENDDEDLLDLPSMQRMMHPVTGGLSNAAETVDCKHIIRKFFKHLAELPWIHKARISFDYTPHGRSDRRRRFEATPPMSVKTLPKHLAQRPWIHEDRITYYDYTPHGRPDRRLETLPPIPYVQMRPEIQEGRIAYYDHTPHGRLYRRLEAPSPMSPHWLTYPRWHQSYLDWDTGITVTSPCFHRSKIGRPPKSTKNAKRPSKGKNKKSLRHGSQITRLTARDEVAGRREDAGLGVGDQAISHEASTPGHRSRHASKPVSPHLNRMKAPMTMPKKRRRTAGLFRLRFWEHEARSTDSGYEPWRTRFPGAARRSSSRDDTTYFTAYTAISGSQRDSEATLVEKSRG